MGENPSHRGASQDLLHPDPADTPVDPSTTSPVAEEVLPDRTAECDRLLSQADRPDSFERTRIGRYRIQRVLGAGGMGIVLLGCDPAFEEQFAIKLVRPELLDEPRVVHAFLREARHMARMDHPHVVPVCEVAEQGDGPYYVMPYFPQGSLSRRIDGRVPLDPGEALAIARQVADALRYAHGLGIIHRDVKPSNVLIAEDGRACLADFGLVRTVFNDTVAGKTNNWCVGTPSYMSPAVAAGQPEDTRCDIYAFGAVLYAMLAGVPPYNGQGRDGKAILDRILAGPPTPIRRLHPAAPAPLVAIAEGAMARELRDRYACMADVVADLDRAAAGRTPAGPRGARPAARSPADDGGTVIDRGGANATTIELAPTRRRSPGSPAIACVALGLAALAVGMALFSRHPGPPPEDQAAAAAAEPAPAINSLTVVISSPDGDAWEISAADPVADPGDRARVEADLVSPACCCLLELQPRGIVQVCYPTPSEGRAATSRPSAVVSQQKFVFPPRGEGVMSLEDDGLGLAAYVLLAWRPSSKVSPEDLQRRAQEEWGKTAPAKDDNAGPWDYDGAGFDRLRQVQVRGPVVEEPQPPRRLKQTCEALRDYPGIEAIRARTFRIQADQPAGIGRGPGQDRGRSSR